MKKIVSCVLALILLVNIFAFTASLATTNPGFFPGYELRYKIEQDLEAAPVTFTAEFKFGVEYNYAASGNEPGSGGILIGNYNGQGESCFFAVKYGYPQFYWRDSDTKNDSSEGNRGDDKVFNAIFDGIETGKTVTAPDGTVCPVTPMYTGETIVLTITRDHANQLVHCYINGELRQSLTYKEIVQNNNGGSLSSQYTDAVHARMHTPEQMKLTDYVIAGDMTSMNRGYIKGPIGNQVSYNKLALYSTMRTAAQIKNEYFRLKNDNRVDTSDPDLIAYFDFAGYKSWDEQLNTQNKITAVKGGYTAHRKWLQLWNPVNLGGDVAYTMAFVGDTQVVTSYSANISGNNTNGDNHLKKVYDWLLNNKEKEKIEIVVGLGDITNTSTDAEWKLALAQIDRLGEKYGNNYIAIQGNHDYKGKGKYTLDLNDQKYDTTFDSSKHLVYDDAINKYSTHLKYTVPAADRMANPISGQKDSMLNFYKKVNICGVPYLFLCLEYAPGDHILEWADGVVEANPNYNVIYVTHGYSAKDGTTLGFDDSTSPDYADDDLNDGMPWGDSDDQNNGEEQWQKFVKKHENICMVVCGHIGNDEVLITDNVGENGNVVKQVLFDHQDIDLWLYRSKPNSYSLGFGSVFLMYFMGDGKTVKTDLIATISGTYIGEFNRKTFTLDLRGTKGGDFSSNVKGQPDGYCTIADVLYAMEAYINKDTSKCDVNGDGKMTLADVTRVASYLNN